MAKEPMFTLAPSGTEYLVTLGGVLVLCADTLYGNPAETTPQGRANAQRMVDRILAEATSRGFRMGDTVRALLRRNEPNRRLMNLAREAVDFIPKDVQTRIIEEELNAKVVPMATEPAPVPKPPASGPDGVDPRFWAAGHALERIRREQGEDAIHRPEHAHLFVEMMRFAPEPLRSQMRAQAEEMGLVPKVTHVGEDGQPIFSIEQMASTLGVSVEVAEAFVANSGIDPAEIYTGPVYPLQ